MEFETLGLQREKDSLINFILR